jgi:transcriptional regulator with XRE-family HTH domain
MRLKQIREAKGMTQDALAKKVGVSRAYLDRLEMGRHDPPLSRLGAIARALKTDIAALVK